MEVFHGARLITRNFRDSVVTIGNFDGVHLGHRQIIELCLAKAKQAGGTSVVYTFRPHPQIALRPQANLQLITTYAEKLELLASLGVEVAVEEPFSREFSMITPEQFFSDVIAGRLKAKTVVVGYDFGFGKERTGTLNVLTSFCKQAGIELRIIPPLKINSETVSSSVIRNYLLNGDIQAANELLGREFSYRGIVIKGDGRGKTMGFPTANIKMEDKLALPYGVYATRTSSGPEVFDSVTNLGIRPTFQQMTESMPVVETHIIGAKNAELDLYGRILEIRFVKRLREERKLGGVEELKEQIAKDIKAAIGALRDA